jgi:carboxylesterase type B
VIMGTNSDETEFLVNSLYPKEINSNADVAEVLNTSYGPNTWDHLKGLVLENTTPRQNLISLTTDLIFTCPTSDVLRSVARNQGVNSLTWRYVFAHHLPLPGIAKKGAFHGLDIPYVFGAIPSEFSKNMQTYWLSFAKNGDPNSAGHALWPKFTSEDEAAIQFGESISEIQTVHNFRADRCADMSFFIQH